MWLLYDICELLFLFNQEVAGSNSPTSKKQICAALQHILIVFLRSLWYSNVCFARSFIYARALA
jgi:hypothetical protein